VIKFASEDEHVHERGVEEELLNALQGAEPEHVADHPRGVVADGESPAFVRYVGAHDLDVTRVAGSERIFVCDGGRTCTPQE
jgi:hypothetical protein